MIYFVMTMLFFEIVKFLVSLNKSKTSKEANSVTVVYTLIELGIITWGMILVYNYYFN